MKSTSTSQAPNTGTRPSTLINAIVLSTVSNSGADSQSLPLQPTPPSDSPESRADWFRRLYLILDFAIAIMDDDDDDLAIAIMDDDDDDCSFMLQ
jgi:hypothetical protein